MPRPSKFDQAIADEICDRMAAGDSLRKITERAEDFQDFPERKTVNRWLRENEDFARQYARAREEQADYYADLIADISSETELGETIEDGPKGRTVKTGDMTQHRRLRIDSLKWIAGKLKPKKYGDRMIHAADDTGPVEVKGGMPMNYRGAPKLPPTGSTGGEPDA